MLRFFARLSCPIATCAVPLELLCHLMLVTCVVLCFGRDDEVDGQVVAVCTLERTATLATLLQCSPPCCISSQSARARVVALPDVCAGERNVAAQCASLYAGFGDTRTRLLKNYIFLVKCVRELKIHSFS